MKKEKIKNIVLIIVVAVMSSTITSFAENNYLFSSNDVKYNNENGVQAETVQGAIDELYACASDYSSVNNKIGSTTLSTTDQTLTGAINELNTTLSGKQASITGAATTVLSSNLTASRALLSDANGKIAVSSTTSTELGYVHGVTSNIQTQLNNLSAVSTVSGTYSGLTIKLTKYGKVVHCVVSGTTTAALATANTYVSIYTIPSAYRPKNSYTFFNLYGSAYIGGVYIGSSSVNLGYTRQITGASNSNLPSGSALYVDTSWITS